MSRRLCACALGVASLAFIGGFSQSAFAGLAIVSESVSIDKQDHEASFDLIFNQAPNFSTVDSYGRHLDSFQYEIVPNTISSIDSFPFTAVRAVIRGDEITAKSLPIRDGFENGGSTSPTSGGWGAVLGQIPYTLTGNEMSFTAPFNLLGTTNGNFAYRVFTTNYGSTVSQAEGVSVPLPSAFWPGLATLGGLVLFFGVSRRQTA